jgi:YD repeat-containing protein
MSKTGDAAVVAIFTGLGAGFERGSGAALGGGGLLGSSALGRGNESVFLNAANGNLILSRQDEFLVGRGPDVAITRTYNSLGNIAHDDNGDLWRQSTDRRVYGLTGTVNTAGSTVKRLSADGSEITYSYNGSFYATTDGAGAHDKLVYNGGDWTDGSTHLREIYKAADGGFISEKIDTDGNKLSFTYTAGKLTRVTTDDGSYTEYSWSGSNITSIATFYTDLATSTAKSLTRTRYQCDGANRLIQVTVDLSPEDHSITDGKVYVTNYTYDGASNRIATISQTDGSALAIEYEYFASDQTYRVKKLTQTVAGGDMRITNIAYVDEAGGIRRTEITDPRGQVTKIFSKIATGELIKVIAPPAFAGATPQEIQYTYDSAGNVTQVTQVGVGQTTYQYDANGNVIQITDANGNVTTRTYNADNSINLETRTGSSASGASTPLYTRYVYDSENHLRYLINPEGRVSEYRYAGTGELLATIEYPQHTFTIGSAPQTLSAMNVWRDGLTDRSSIQYTQFVYDGRGNLTDTYRYGVADTSGSPLNGEGYARTRLVYDQAGQLLSRNVHGQQSESFVYDGLGRLTASTDLAGGTTTIVFNDAATTTTVTTALGATMVSTYNKAGELINRSESGSYVNGGTRAYYYDKNGQLRMSVDGTPEARKSYILYDKTGRKVADIGHDGQLIEYRYDQAGRLVATAYFFNKLTAAQLTTLADPDSEVELGSGGFPRPTAHSYDVWQWNVYDAGGRVVGQIGGDGSVTAYEYDQAGRLVTTRGYYNKLSSGQVAAYMSAAPATLTLPTADAVRDVFVSPRRRFPHQSQTAEEKQMRRTGAGVARGDRDCGDDLHGQLSCCEGDLRGRHHRQRRRRRRRRQHCQPGRRRRCRHPGQVLLERGRARRHRRRRRRGPRQSYA